VALPTKQVATPTHSPLPIPHHHHHNQPVLYGEIPISSDPICIRSSSVPGRTWTGGRHGSRPARSTSKGLAQTNNPVRGTAIVLPVSYITLQPYSSLISAVIDLPPQSRAESPSVYCIAAFYHSERRPTAVCNLLKTRSYCYAKPSRLLLLQ